MPFPAINQIMVAVADTQVRSNKAIRRAADIAHKTGASLHLFHTTESRYGMAPGVALSVADQMVRYFVASREADLERVALRLRREELVVTTSVAWDYPPHESIVRAATRYNADLIVIEAHRHNVLARLLLTQTDFELIKLSKVPLLIVKGSRAWRRPHVLAALDPFHARAKPAGLDAQLVDVARRIATDFGGKLLVGHSYLPLTTVAPGAAAEPIVIPSGEAEQKAYRKQIKQVFERELSALDIPARDSRLVEGDPVFRLPRLAKSLRCSLVVMGAVSRSRIKSMFVGHTAQRVLDRLSCDVMVVKPELERPR